MTDYQIQIVRLLATIKSVDETKNILETVELILNQQTFRNIDMMNYIYDRLDLDIAIANDFVSILMPILKGRN